MTHHAYVDSPLGRILLVGNEEGLIGINFQDAGGRKQPPAGSTEARAPLRDAIHQLDQYFRRERRRFDLALAPRGTQFQRAVWDRLLEVPYGRTTTYGELARDLGRPTASRAVGAANGRNPLPIVVPCHRVVGSDGALTGYYGGLHIKRFLLELESAKRSL